MGPCRMIGSAAPRPRRQLVLRLVALCLAGCVDEMTVTDGERDISVLPATPAQQRLRYGIEGTAIVPDGLYACS